MKWFPFPNKISEAITSAFETAIFRIEATGDAAVNLFFDQPIETH